MTQAIETDEKPKLNFLQRVKAMAKDRKDSWINTLTGMGTDRDRRTGGAMVATGAGSAQVWIDLYEEDPIAARICDMPGREMMRQGFSLERDDEADDEAEDDETVRSVKKTLDDLGAAQAIEEAIAWGRCTGKGLVLIGAEDGIDAKEPLDPERVESIRWLRVYDRTRVTVERRYTDPKHAKFGEPELYRLVPIEGVADDEDSLIHESRFIPFGGARTSDRSRRANDSNDFSVLKRVYEAIRDYHAAHASGGNMMTDASQAVWRMAGVLDAITGTDSQAMLLRVMASDVARSQFRAIVLDSDPKYGESFEKIPTSFAGVSDMLDSSGNYLSACAGYPITVLLGRSPAGLNATGESDIRLFYDQIKTDRTQIVQPAIMRLVDILTRGKSDGWKVCFPSLWQESPKEKAEREKAEAERDKVYFDIEVATPEEIALAPHIEAVYPNIDRSIREEEIAARASEKDVPEKGGELVLAPTDAATVVTVNEARLSLGLPALDGPDGALTLSAYKAKYADTIAAAASAESGTDPNAPPPAAPPVPPKRVPPPEEPAL